MGGAGFAGDKVLDFDGRGAGPGDTLEFHGYGSAEQGASFTQLDATHWVIRPANGLVSEIITFARGAAIHQDDYIFT